MGIFNFLQRLFTGSKEESTSNDTSNHKWLQNLSQQQITQGYSYFFKMYKKLIGVEFSNVKIGRQNSYPSKTVLLNEDSCWKFSVLGTAVLHKCFSDSNFESELKELLRKNSINESSKISTDNYDYWEGEDFIIETPKKSNLILISNNNVINSARTTVAIQNSILRDSGSDEEYKISESIIDNKFGLDSNKLFFLKENMVLAKIYELDLGNNPQNLPGPTMSNSDIALQLINDNISPFSDEQISNGIANIEHLYFRKLRGIRFDKIELPTNVNYEVFTYPQDIDGNWYFTDREIPIKDDISKMILNSSNGLMIAKAFSKSKKALDELLYSNNIDKKTKESDDFGPYWIGEGFMIRHFINSNLIIIFSSTHYARGHQICS
jgi:hypothetical protein